MFRNPGPLFKLSTSLLIVSILFSNHPFPIFSYYSLREKCPYWKLFWSAFSRIRTVYGEISQTECGKIRTRTTPNTGTFYAVTGKEFHQWIFVNSQYFFAYFGENFAIFEKLPQDKAAISNIEEELHKLDKLKFFFILQFSLRTFVLAQRRLTRKSKDYVDSYVTRLSDQNQLKYI